MLPRAAFIQPPLSTRPSQAQSQPEPPWLLGPAWRIQYYERTKVIESKRFAAFQRQLRLPFVSVFHCFSVSKCFSCFRLFHGVSACFISCLTMPCHLIWLMKKPKP